ncbi:hypothetical protein ACTI_21440 [Actinoplanes sp. OR16]|uniref:hypothetical protein n=1 Tax=Actinoplanes sp. OR16 TaxID=946334 RepID=UPI000F6C29DD|nr:hypothetical protein [Actinoplanes sp. OR16]BBH65459.1 hypothetical protein ACTI_21440 [Actinoplanes sp. OR16]
MFIDHGGRALAVSRGTGLAGSLLIAGGGFTARALPSASVVRHAQAGLVCVYSGLVLLLLAWWWYGRVTRSTRDDRWTLGRWSAPLTGAPVAEGLWRVAGLLAVGIIAALVWAHRDRLGPVYGLGIVLLAVVFFGPAIRPWYVVWGLVPLAALGVLLGAAVFLAVRMTAVPRVVVR